jgi:hypothetical protein
VRNKVHTNSTFILSNRVELRMRNLTYCGISDKGLPVGNQLIQGGLLVILAADNGDGRLLSSLHLEN